MTWPQVVVMLIVAFGAISTIVAQLRDRSQSHAAVLAWITFQLAISAAYVWVLHEGGFW